MDSDDKDLLETLKNSKPLEKKKRKNRFLKENLGPIHIENKKENIKILENFSINQTSSATKDSSDTNKKYHLIMEKKDINNNLQKTIELTDFATNIINGIVTIRDHKKNKTIIAPMENGKIHGKVSQLLSNGSYSNFTYVDGIKNGPMKVFNNKEKNLIKGYFKDGKLHKKITFKNLNTWQTFKVDKKGKVQKPLIQILKIPFLIIQTILNFIKRIIISIITGFIKIIQFPYKIINYCYKNIKSFIEYIKKYKYKKS